MDRYFVLGGTYLKRTWNRTEIEIGISEDLFKLAIELPCITQQAVRCSEGRSRLEGNFYAAPKLNVRYQSYIPSSLAGKPLNLSRLFTVPSHVSFATLAAHEVRARVRGSGLERE
jgi:hypothetical protein